MPPLVEARHYDNSAAMGRMGDLIRIKGEAEAQRQHARGQAAAQGWAGAGIAINKTIGDLVDYAGKEPARKRQEAMAEREERKARREDNLQGLMTMSADMPEAERIALLKREGYVEEAGKLQAVGIQAARAAVDAQNANFELGKNKLDKAVGIVNGIAAKPPAEQAAAFAEARPTLVELAGPELASAIPEQFDAEWLKKAPTLGLNAMQTISTRQAAESHLLALGRDVREGKRDMRDALQDYTKFGAQLMVTAAEGGLTPEEHETQIQTLVKNGADETTMRNLFPPDSAAAKATAFLQSDKTAPTPGSFGAYVNAWKTAHPGQEPTTTQILGMRHQYEAAGWKPESSTSKQLTDKDIFEISNARQASYLKLDNALKAKEITQAQYNERVDQVERQYAKVLGLPPGASRPLNLSMTPTQEAEGVYAEDAAGGSTPGAPLGAGVAGGGAPGAPGAAPRPNAFGEAVYGAITGSMPGVMKDLVEVPPTPAAPTWNQPPTTDAAGRPLTPGAEPMQGPPGPPPGAPAMGGPLGAAAPGMTPGPSAPAFDKGPPVSMSGPAPSPPPMPPVAPPGGVAPMPTPAPPGGQAVPGQPPVQGPHAQPPAAPPPLKPGEFPLTLPDGTVHVFDNKQQAEAFLAKYGLTLQGER